MRMKNTHKGWEIYTLQSTGGVCVLCAERYGVRMRARTREELEHMINNKDRTFDNWENGAERERQ